MASLGHHTHRWWPDSINQYFILTPQTQHQYIRPACCAGSSDINSCIIVGWSWTTLPENGWLRAPGRDEAWRMMFFVFSDWAAGLSTVAALPSWRGNALKIYRYFSSQSNNSRHSLTDHWWIFFKAFLVWCRGQTGTDLRKELMKENGEKEFWASASVIK